MVEEQESGAGDVYAELSPEELHQIEIEQLEQRVETAEMIAHTQRVKAATRLEELRTLREENGRLHAVIDRLTAHPGDADAGTLELWRRSVLERAVNAGLLPGQGLCPWFEALAQFRKESEEMVGIGSEDFRAMSLRANRQHILLRRVRDTLKGQVMGEGGLVAMIDAELLKPLKP